MTSVTRASTFEVGALASLQERVAGRAEVVSLQLVEAAAAEARLQSVLPQESRARWAEPRVARFLSVTRWRASTTRAERVLKARKPAAPPCRVVTAPVRLQVRVLAAAVAALLATRATTPPRVVSAEVLFGCVAKSDVTSARRLTTNVRLPRRSVALDWVADSGRGLVPCIRVRNDDGLGISHGTSPGSVAGIRHVDAALECARGMYSGGRAC